MPELCDTIRKQAAEIERLQEIVHNRDKEIDDILRDVEPCVKCERLEKELRRLTAIVKRQERHDERERKLRP